MNKPNCDCEESSCKEGCTRGHTHKGFSCEKCTPTNKETTPEWEKKVEDLTDAYISDFYKHGTSEEKKWVVSANLREYEGRVKDFIRTLLATSTAEARQVGKDEAVNYLLRKAWVHSCQCATPNQTPCSGYLIKDQADWDCARHSNGE